MTDQNFQAMRRAMVESQLRTNDVNDPVLIEAVLATPREAFLPAERRAAAYIDRAVPLANGRALNPPLSTARLLVEAGPVAGEKVLLVGAATGYCAALLAKLGCSVVALEDDAALAAQAQAMLADNAAVRVETGPLAQGVAGSAPYDLILVDGAVEALPDALVDQLKIGGRAAFAIVERGVTRLCMGVRSAGGFGARTIVDLEAVILPGFAAPQRFTF